MHGNNKYVLPCMATDIVLDYSRKTLILIGTVVALSQEAGEETDSEQWDVIPGVFKLYHTAS